MKKKTVLILLALTAAFLLSSCFAVFRMGAKSYQKSQFGVRKKDHSYLVLFLKKADLPLKDLKSSNIKALYGLVFKNVKTQDKIAFYPNDLTDFKSVSAPFIVARNVLPGEYQLTGVLYKRLRGYKRKKVENGIRFSFDKKDDVLYLGEYLLEDKDKLMVKKGNSVDLENYVNAVKNIMQKADSSLDGYDRIYQKSWDFFSLNQRTAYLALYLSDPESSLGDFSKAQLMADQKYEKYRQLQKLIKEVETKIAKDKEQIRKEAEASLKKQSKS